MRRLLLVSALIFAFCAGGFAQYSYSSTSIYQSGGTVYASSYAEIDYNTAQYYWLTLYGELDQCNECFGSNTITWGAPSGATTSLSWSASTPLSYNYFTVWAQVELSTYYYYYDSSCGCYGYEDEYGYSLVEYDSGTPDLYVYAPCTYEETYTQTLFMGLSYSVADATTNPPNISALQLWTGDWIPGSSGYWVLYGTDLTDVYGATVSSSGCSGVTVTDTYDSPNQINLSYSIDSGMTPGACSIIVNTPYGSSSVGFTVYPPIGFDTSDPTSLYNYVSALGGGSPSDVEAAVAASGVLNDPTQPLTTDNINIMGVGNLASDGGSVILDPTFENYYEQMGFSFQSAAVPATNPADWALPNLISILVGAIEAGSATLAAGAVALGACLLMDGSHASKWNPANYGQCAAQRAADEQTCMQRFPSGSGQVSKYNACMNHAVERYVLCMKGLPVPPLQPTN